MGFRGTRIGFATGGGTMTVFNEKTQKFEIVNIEYGDQELKLNRSAILRTKKWFYMAGESLSSSRQTFTGDNFDYIIYIKRTTAL
jgi:hypothetical protein